MLCGGLSTTAMSQQKSVEDVYIARSWRESRVAPTDFCAQSRTGFANSNIEDRYTFRSTTTRASDGLMTDANVRTIGTLHACFATGADSTQIHFYGEGVLGGVAFTGNGECKVAHQDFPEPGLRVLHCFLDLGKLPAGYVGGQLTTNSVLSRALLGGPSDPPGYTTPSIATIRLWKHR
jgi:hypothetical protein